MKTVKMQYNWIVICDVQIYIQFILLFSATFVSLFLLVQSHVNLSSHKSTIKPS